MLIPPPPWRFSNARILYQPTLVPVEAARKVTPSSGLSLLSLFGWTLGGIFVVDWTSSPIGPYREVAILSGLVTSSRYPIVEHGIGAWASHIVVDSIEAAESGRDLFGLPTNVGLVEFNETATIDSDGLRPSWLFNTASNIALVTKYAIGSAVPGVAEPAEKLNRRPTTWFDVPSSFVFQSDRAIQINGWNGWLPLQNIDETSRKSKKVEGTGISLPSFSGRLSGRTPLLKYPLRLVSAKSARLRRPMTTISKIEGNDNLNNILGGPCISPCLQFDGVEVVAGKPAEIDD